MYSLIYFTCQRSYRNFSWFLAPCNARLLATCRPCPALFRAKDATSLKPSNSTGSRRFLPQVSNSNPASLGAVHLPPRRCQRSTQRHEACQGQVPTPEKSSIRSLAGFDTFRFRAVAVALPLPIVRECRLPWPRHLKPAGSGCICPRAFTGAGNWRRR